MTQSTTSVAGHILAPPTVDEQPRRRRGTYLGVPCGACGVDTIPGSRGECLWCEHVIEAST